ncbi:MAG: hypothetical protein ABSC18_16050 [Verrucomicrobiota bacterium]
MSLLTTVGLTNLDFALTCPAGFLTNWNVSSTNAAIASATVAMANTSQPQFSFGVQGGQVLQGSSVIGSICVDALPGSSAFVPLAVANFGATTAINSPAAVSAAQGGQVVVVGNKPLLGASLGTNSSPMLTLYGNAGVNYELLSTTNLSGSGWTTAGSVTLTNLSQLINLGGATNRMQFFEAVQP